MINDKKPLGMYLEKMEDILNDADNFGWWYEEQPHVIKFIAPRPALGRRASRWG